MRLATLLLLADEPRNGYQLMQAIEDRTAGRWRPSPGSVYPTLAQLEDEGLIRAVEREGTKLFELTDQGTEHIAGLGEAPAPWEQEGGPGEDALHELHSLARQVMMAVRQVAHAADEGQLERARTVLKDTRRALYRILADEGEE
jgi:DNA-binding PadR family transcriptional regulator